MLATPRVATCNLAVNLCVPVPINMGRYLFCILSDCWAGFSRGSWQRAHWAVLSIISAHSWHCTDLKVRLSSSSSGHFYLMKIVLKPANICLLKHNEIQWSHTETAERRWGAVDTRSITGERKGRQHFTSHTISAVLKQTAEKSSGDVLSSSPVGADWGSGLSPLV